MPPLPAVCRAPPVPPPSRTSGTPSVVLVSDVAPPAPAGDPITPPAPTTSVYVLLGSSVTIVPVVRAPPPPPPPPSPEYPFPLPPPPPPTPRNVTVIASLTV